MQVFLRNFSKNPVFLLKNHAPKYLYGRYIKIQPAIGFLYDEKMVRVFSTFCVKITQE